MEPHGRRLELEELAKRRKDGAKLDLDDLAKRHNLRVEISPADDPLEEEFQRNQRELDARFQRWRDVVLFGVGIILTISVSSICLWIAISRNFSADEKKWATSALTLITGAILGYLIGKAAK